MKKSIIIGIVAILAIFVFIFLYKDTFTSTSDEQTNNIDLPQQKPIYIGQTNIVGALEPTNDGTPWSLTSHGISETLYKLDENGNLVSRFISLLQQVDTYHWHVTLKPDVLFSDGSAVNAQAVSECMNQIMQENKLALSTVGKMIFTPTDEWEFTIQTERPTKVMNSVLTEWTNIVFKKLDNGQYLFTGPYVVAELNPGVQLKLMPNPYYAQATQRLPIILKAFKDSSAMQLAFQSGELDMAFTITPDMAMMLKEQRYNVKHIDAGYQYFNIINQQKAPFNNIKIREALNYSLDRDTMIKALHGGRLASGFFAHYYSFNGHSKPQFNAEQADRLFDEAGWLKEANGIRTKNGDRLSITLATYPTRPDLVMLMQIIASQLKERGIEIRTQLVDGIDAYARKGDFDLLVYSQHTAPTAEPTFALNQFFRTEGGKNFNGYSSQIIDSLLDEMGTMTPGQQRDELAFQVQEQLFNDLPIFYLVDPQWSLAVSNRLKDYAPYGGDYYVVTDNLIISQ